MTEDEVTAVHEAAHAVFAVFGAWTKLAGPVALASEGVGDVVMSTDVAAISRSLAADPGFDRDLPRIQLIGALLAGPIAERLLCERGQAELSERALSDAGQGDYGVVAEQLAAIAPPRPGLLEQLEREVRERLEQPATWAAVERFAAILLDLRRLEADEASAILERLRAEAGDDANGAPGKIRERPSVIGLLAVAALALAVLWHLLA